MSTDVDVIVVGTGAGALTAAIAAKDMGGDVLVVEKDSKWGGTSATSGGGIWIPCSPLGMKAGLKDSPKEAFEYIKKLTGNDVSDERIKAFIKAAPEMLEYMIEKTRVAYRAQPYADYHTDLPGAKLGFRMHEPVEIEADDLGNDYFTLQETHPIAMLFGRIAWVISESYPIMTRSKGWRKVLAKMFLRYFLDFPHRFKTWRDRRLTMGNALLGRLRMSVNERNIPVWLNAPMVDVVTEDNRVCGVVVDRDGSHETIRARRGVIFGAGGFERNSEMRQDNHGVDSEFTASIGKNTGDGQNIGKKIGAKLDIMDTAWWAPGYKFEGDEVSYPMFVERALPHGLIVNQKGDRYMNEAASYHVTGKIMADADQKKNPTLPSWFIFDGTFRAKYALGPILPGNFLPDWCLPKKVKSKLIKAKSIADLAQKLNMDEKRLEKTIKKLNVYAETGVDKDFNRGGFDYDRYYGDPSSKPNPCIGKIETAPFYAIAIYAADIGTKGGLLTDVNAQVVDQDDKPIPGFYAVGNSSSSVMGRTYPGAGSVIGPAMTFGYLAGRHAMGANS